MLIDVKHAHIAKNIHEGTDIYKGTAAATCYASGREVIMRYKCLASIKKAYGMLKNSNKL